jgi:hypothetical protein
MSFTLEDNNTKVEAGKYSLKRKLIFYGALAGIAITSYVWYLDITNCLPLI